MNFNFDYKFFNIILNCILITELFTWPKKYLCILAARIFKLRLCKFISLRIFFFWQFALCQLLIISQCSIATICNGFWQSDKCDANYENISLSRGRISAILAPSGHRTALDPRGAARGKAQKWKNVCCLNGLCWKLIASLVSLRSPHRLGSVYLGDNLSSWFVNFSTKPCPIRVNLWANEIVTPLTNFGDFSQRIAIACPLGWWMLFRFFFFFGSNCHMPLEISVDVSSCLARDLWHKAIILRSIRNVGALISRVVVEPLVFQEVCNLLCKRFRWQPLGYLHSN